MPVTYLNKTYKTPALMIKDIIVLEEHRDMMETDNFIQAIYRTFQLAPDAFVTLSRCDISCEPRYAIGSGRKEITTPMTVSDFVQASYCFEFLKGVKCYG